jgi:dihydrofolate reductase
VQLTLTTFLTLDGVMQSPGAPDEDRRGGFTQGGWLIPYADDDMGRFIGETVAQADGFLLGRKTYEIFSRHWPHVTDENPIAAALNRLPKHVVSTTVDTLSWANTTVVRGDLIEQITKLKAHQGRELQIHGSGQLARSLMTHNLIDEYRLWIYPVVVGGVGTRLFDDPTPAALRLIDSKTTASGISVLTYRPDGELRQSSFAVAPEPAQHRILR